LTRPWPAVLILPPGLRLSLFLPIEWQILRPFG
jgi:hypothetical protein